MLEILSLVVILLFSIYFFRQKSRNDLPGPRGLPLFGVAFQIDFNRLHLKLFEWTTSYGDIFQFSTLGKTYVSLNSGEIIREVLGTEPNATIASSREPSFFGAYCNDNYSDVAFAPYSKKWTKRRKLTHRILHTYGEGIQIMEDEILKKLKNVKRYLAEKGNKNVDPQHVVEEFLFENLASLVAGTTDKELQRLMKEMDESANAITMPMVDLIFRTFPFLMSLPFSFTKKPVYCRNATVAVMNTIQKIMLEKDIEKGMYYEMMKESDPNSFKPTDSVIKCIISNVIEAGFLTSRGTLMSLIHLLAEYPDIQSRVQTEIDDVIGRRDPHVTDRNDCPFAEAVILETLRYITHTPLTIPHYTSETCIIRGHTIDKGTRILINLWAAHHSTEWVDPFKFRPDRFLDESGQLLPATHPIRKRFNIFGYGKRSCIGEVFAKNRTFLFLVTLLQTCNVTKPSEQSLTALDPRDMMVGVVQQPHPFKVQFKLRKETA